VYHIAIAQPVRSWLVLRRYSAFAALHAALAPLLLAELPALPPRHAARHVLGASLSRLGLGAAAPLHAGAEEDAAATERRLQLQRFLRAVLCCVAAPRTQAHDAAVPHLAAFLDMAPSDLLALAARVRDEETPMPAPAAATSSAAPAAPRAPPAAAPGGFTRAFGSAAAAAPHAQETAATRALSSQALLDSQSASMAAQDAQLGDLAAVLRRQRTLAGAMNAELAQQNELLQSFGGELESVQRKMGTAQGQMKRLG
jgi:regulator of vacuolar morphogenesis